MNFFLKNKRGSDMLFPPLMFIILNIVFFGVLLLFVVKASTGALVYEQAYAKQVALLIDEAKSDMQILVDFEDGIKTAEKNKKTKDLIRVDKEENKVIVNLGGGGGYGYKYFSDYEVNVYENIKAGVIVINIGEGIWETAEILQEDSGKSFGSFEDAIAKSGKCKDYSGLILKYAEEYDVNPILVLALIIQESGCNKMALSSASCAGLMQICSWQECTELGLTSSNWRDVLTSDVEKNIECGVKILEGYYNSAPKKYECSSLKINENRIEPAVDKTYSGWERALRAYNGWSCAGYRKDGSLIDADQDYVEKINKKYASLGGGELNVA